MFKGDVLKMFVFSVISISCSATAENIRVFNGNFESDVVPLPSTSADLASVNKASGWISTGTGETGTMIPQGNGVHYNGIIDQAQVAYLNAGGRMSQNVGTRLESGETYTLTFDVGRRLDQVGRNLVARIKADGTTLAMIQSDNFSSEAGAWSTESITFTATKDMPIGKVMAVEFYNLARTAEHQVNIDNVRLTAAGTGTMLGVVDDIELKVPEDYATIPEALAFLDERLISAGAIVTVKVSDCSEQVYSAPIEITHFNSQFIHIVGDIDAPENCVLQFNNSNGLELKNGAQLGLLDGFTINGNRTLGSRGIYVTKGAIFQGGEGLVVSNFQEGIYSDLNASVFSENISLTDNSSFGSSVNNNSYANLSRGQAQGNANGYQASHNSVINGIYSSATSNINYGYRALYSSFLLADGSSVRGGSNRSYHSQWHSVISAKRSDASSSSSIKYYSHNHSYQNITGSTLLGSSSYSPGLNSVSSRGDLIRR